MAEEGDDQLTEMLEDGWELAGYSVNMAEMGALMHSILLRKGSKLTSLVIVTQGDKELGRNVSVLAPKPEQKKGFFG